MKSNVLCIFRWVIFIIVGYLYFNGLYVLMGYFSSGGMCSLLLSLSPSLSLSLTQCLSRSRSLSLALSLALSLFSRSLSRSLALSLPLWGSPPLIHQSRLSLPSHRVPVLQPTKHDILDSNFPKIAVFEV